MSGDMLNDYERASAWTVSIVAAAVQSSTGRHRVTVGT